MTMLVIAMDPIVIVRRTMMAMIVATTARIRRRVDPLLGI
jgi:hypothetical protein